MPDDVRLTETEWHTKCAKDLFNLTWDYLDRTDRSPDDDAAMLNAAYGSCYHWSVIGQPVNFARGEWQLARVHAVLGQPEGALRHAGRSLAICEANGIGDFDLAFAHEALARAHAVAGNTDNTKRHIALAQEAATKIAEEDNRKYFLGELATVPGFETT